MVHGCGNGDSGSGGSTPIDTNPMSPGTVLSAGPGCDLQYTLTDNPVLTGADPLLGDQWHLRNTGQTGGVAGEDIRAFFDAHPLPEASSALKRALDRITECTTLRERQSASVSAWLATR